MSEQCGGVQFRSSVGLIQFLWSQMSDGFAYRACTTTAQLQSCMDCTDAHISGLRHARSDSDVFKHDFIFVSQSTHINCAKHFLLRILIQCKCQRRTTRKVSVYSLLFSSFTAFLASAAVIFLCQKASDLADRHFIIRSLYKKTYILMRSYKSNLYVDTLVTIAFYCRSV